MSARPHNFGKVALRLGVVAVAAAGLSGCQSIDVNAANVAQLRLIDASPDAPGLDFYANNNALAYNLGFGTATSYVSANPGNYTIAAEAAGTRSVLTSANQSLSIGHEYTVLVGNVNASLQETILLDQNQPAPTGQISVRFLDEATRVGAVDVYLVPSTGKLATTSPVVTNINFQTNTGYINVPAGTYAIAIVPTGTVPVSTTVTLLTGASVGYSAGAVRTVVLIDQQITTSPGVQAIVADDYDSVTSTS